MTEAYDAIWTDARLATLRRDSDTPYGAIEQAALAVRDGLIAYVGPMAGLDEEAARTARLMDASGGWITPALVDCHTHLVHGGNRAREFEMRLGGASYEEIARAGGGILSTVNATRAASEHELVETALPRLEALKAEGVTLVEIKSGYGLDVDNECKMLRAARRLGAEDNDFEIVTTFLGAHALPPEYSGRADAYIDFVCNEMLPAVAAEGLADAVDCFCERIAFDATQTARVFEAARRHGLPVKLHAEQLSDQGGAALAARSGALSADHLEYLSTEGVAAMADAGTVAVLLPGAFYFLRETQLPPIEALRAGGVPMALATDCNPGSSPVSSPLLMLNMACTLFRMTPEEALAGLTREGARALGAADRLGTLEVGKQADFVLWNIDHPAELAYRIGFNPLESVVKDGRLLV